LLRGIAGLGRAGLLRGIAGLVGVHGIVHSLSFVSSASRIISSTWGHH
jgi:hypothetical protein